HYLYDVFFSSRRRHTIFSRDWSSDVCSSDLFDIQFKVTSDEGDALLWYFPYKKNILTLHYNIFTGISIFPGKYREAGKEENEAVADLAKKLEMILGKHYRS